MALKLSNAAARAMCDALVDLLDAGAGPALLRIYDGAAPAGPDVAVGAQTLLAELTFSDPAFGAAADANPGATATASAIAEDASANASGTASWFRVVDSNGVAIIDGTVGTSGADLNLVTTTLVATQPVEITSFTITVPES